MWLTQIMVIREAWSQSFCLSPFLEQVMFLCKYAQYCKHYTSKVVNWPGTLYLCILKKGNLATKVSTTHTERYSTHKVHISSWGESGCIHSIPCMDSWWDFTCPQWTGTCISEHITMAAHAILPWYAIRQKKFPSSINGELFHFIHTFTMPDMYV